MNDVKTCVYTISLNEIKHVEKFVESCKPADIILVCDTGSTDGTDKLLESLGVTVYRISQKPWRFDIPRNTALNLIPNDIDICLSIDLDEYLQPGWYETLNKQWHKLDGNINRVRYDYIWNWKEDNTTPDIRFFAEKIHSRHGYMWKHPCHEALYWMNQTTENVITIPEIILHHRADSNKSRGQYLPLLKVATEESPENDRMAFYYARELYFHQEYLEAAKQFKRHISMSYAWNKEKAASMRYLSKIESDKKEYWLKKAIEECPNYRELLVELAFHYYSNCEFDLGYIYAKQAIAIENKDQSYLCENFAWGDFPYDIASICAHNIGIKQKAIDYAKIGVKINPQNTRLLSNLHEFKKT